MATTMDRPVSLVSLQKSTNKKSFDYKMCKKVAELTQVVHMLFTKSHEKDIELELTKKAYEQEIVDIISDAQGRLRKVRMSCEDEQRRSEQRLTELHSEQVRDLQRKLLQYTEKLEECGKELLKKKKEISELNSRLTVTKQSRMCNNNTELSHLKGGQNLPSERASRPDKDLTVVSNQQTSSSSDVDRMEHVKQQCIDLEQMLRERDADIEKLKQLKINIEKENLKVKTELTETKRDKEHLDTSYNARISALQSELSESSRTQIKLQQKVKTLENELKAQQKELQKAQLESGSRSRFSSSPRQLTSSDNIPKNVIELERMRRELERYRLELSNREGNFNRMFTNSSPVRVDSRLRGLSLGMTRQKSVNMGSSASNLQQKYLKTTHAETQKEKDPAKRLPLLAMEGRSKTSTNLKHSSATGNTSMQLRDRSIARKTDMFQQAF
ncbi:hypothetical protein HOLleu_29031 [Holothuria leucospilota]|uniref:Uncharacterized protein n=1 Tax=Holothuria leucospilota TaxID=206669 RepID=A0A9Q1H1X7_HOLLE|nr:hypothetical protein HOLleu_29031 [Holothuria leucospilota]